GSGCRSTAAASASTSSAASSRRSCRGRGRRRGRGAGRRDPAAAAAPCPSCGRRGRRDTASHRRRPCGRLRYPLRVDGKRAIGVDVGGTKILAGLVADDGEVLRRYERATPQDSEAHVVAELEAAVAELLDDSVAALGFGVPAPIDQRRGLLFQPVNTRLANVP